MHANRIELALEHIPASSVAKENFSEAEKQQAEELLKESTGGDGVWGQAEWYHWCGEHGISLDIADQLWYWYHPEEYDGELYKERRKQANFDRPGVPEWVAEQVRRAEGITNPEEARDFLRNYEMK